jgi:hypothetical protein
VKGIKMSYCIKSYKGIEDISFGESIETVHDKVGAPLEEFYRGPDNTCFTNVYPDYMVYYKDSKYVEAIEFYGDIDVEIEGINIGSSKFDSLLEAFSKEDHQIIVDEDGFTSEKFGFGVYCPSWRDSDDLEVESVIVFEKGYYE